MIDKDAVLDAAAKALRKTINACEYNGDVGDLCRAIRANAPRPVVSAVVDALLDALDAAVYGAECADDYVTGDASAAVRQALRALR